MKQHLTPEELALYSEFLQQNNTEIAPLHIIEHTNQCSQCANEAIELSFIADTLANELKFENQNKTKSVFFYRKTILAIAAILLLFVSVWQITDYFVKKNKVYYAKKISIMPKILVNNRKPIKPADTIKNEVIKEPQNNKLLACYEPHIETEKLIENFTANSRSQDIEVSSSQKITSAINKKIMLEWKNLDNIELTIEIFDNKINKVENNNLTGNNYTIKNNLTAGLYYWKLFNSDFDLIYCGKIIVK